MLVHTSGALERLTFANIDFTVQELEYLTAVINAYFARRGGAAGNAHAGSQGLGQGGSAESGEGAIAGAAEAHVVVENELQPSVLTDLFHAPGFVDAPAPGGAAGDVATRGARAASTAAFASGSAGAQQRDALARLSGWDSDGAAALRATPALVSKRVRAETSAGSGLTLTLRPEVAVSTVKLLGWIVAFVVALVLLEALFLEALITEEREEEEHNQTYAQANRYLRALLNGFFGGILMLLVVYLVGLAVMAAPRYVELRVGQAGWRLASGLRASAGRRACGTSAA